jgi:hypothetical protein
LKNDMRPCSNVLSAAALVALTAGLSGTGCGGPAGGAKSADVVPSNAQSAASELDRAEGEITALFGPASAPAAQASASPSAPPPATAAVSPPSAAPAAEAPAAGKAEHLAAGDAPDACGVACRALASMERAATHLCGLSGDGEPMCTNARERVKNATERVTARCTCEH